MLYRDLGNSGISASAVGMGTWAMGGWMWGGADEANAIRAIHAGIDAGMNLIDTAPMYGFGASESVVGKAIHDRRDRVVLATKCGLVCDTEKGEFFFHSSDQGPTSEPSTYRIHRYLGPESIRRELEASLRRLQTDHIDLYQTHWQDATTPIQDTMACLLALKDEGKIRAIGVSNCTPAQLSDYGDIDVDQELYSMFDRGIEEDGRLSFCQQRNISVLAYSPLAQGLLTGKMGPDRQFAEGDQRNQNARFSPENRRRIADMLDEWRPIAEANNASLAQLAIAWTAAQPGITHVLCGVRNDRQALQNAGGGMELTDADCRSISEILARRLPTLTV